jgi:two-component system, chemotaxis family, protein-glutamate methylesterase/glutaminase
MTADLIVIGVSAGGLAALTIVLGALPADFPMAIVVVQHRSRDSDALCDVLQRGAALRVQEATDKAPLEPGIVYVAPPDYHLFIEEDGLSLSLDAPELYSRPSIDIAFESAADSRGARVVGIVLTGANHDGARGLRRIVDRGGRAIVQDPPSAEVPVMPAAALKAVPEATVVTLEQLPGVLIDLAAGIAPAARRRS